MLHALSPIVIRMSAGFENIVEADYVAVDVRVGISDRLTNTRLRSQIDDDVELIVLKQLVYQRLIS